MKDKGSGSDETSFEQSNKEASLMKKEPDLKHSVSIVETKNEVHCITI